MKCPIDGKCFVHYLHRSTPKSRCFIYPLNTNPASLRKEILHFPDTQINFPPRSEQLPRVTLNKTWRQFVPDLVTHSSSILQRNLPPWIISKHEVCVRPLTWVAHPLTCCDVCWTNQEKINVCRVQARKMEFHYKWSQQILIGKFSKVLKFTWI